VLGLLLVWQLYGALFGGGAPKALKWLHEDTFLVARVDVESVLDSNLFEWLTEQREVEEAWEHWLERVEESLGLGPDDLRGVTFTVAHPFTAAWQYSDPLPIVYLETTQELDLERMGEELPGEVEGLYTIDGGPPVFCRLDTRLYLMCDGPAVVEAVREGAGSELDASMQRVLDDVDWSAEASLAFDISALPIELLEEVATDALMEISNNARDARLMRDLEGLTGAMDLKSDSMRYTFDVLCEDGEVADDLLDALEDGLEAVEELPGLPRAVDDFLETVSLRARGESVALEVTVTEEMLEDLLGLMLMGGAAPPDSGFTYELK